MIPRGVVEAAAELTDASEEQRLRAKLSIATAGLDEAALRALIAVAASMKGTP